MSPVIGVGVDFKYRMRYRDGGLAGWMAVLNSRLSHLSVVNVLSGEDAREVRNLWNGPLLHHLPGISPANPGEMDDDRVSSHAALSCEMKAAWTCEDIGLWRFGELDLPYFQAPLFTEEHADHIVCGIQAMQARMQVPFLAEIPSCTAPIGNLSLGEFFHRIVAGARCGIVLDVSHVYSYALATGRSPRDVLTSLPLDAAREIHVAGGRISTLDASRYVDSHSDAFAEEVLDLLELSIPRCGCLGAITFEVGVSLALADVLAMFTLVEEVARRHAFAPRLQC